jgi:hypothetical protein
MRISFLLLFLILLSCKTQVQVKEASPTVEVAPPKVNPDQCLIEGRVFEMSDQKAKVIVTGVKYKGHSFMENAMVGDTLILDLNVSRGKFLFLLESTPAMGGSTLQVKKATPIN